MKGSLHVSTSLVKQLVSVYGHLCAQSQALDVLASLPREGVPAGWAKSVITTGEQIGRLGLEVAAALHPSTTDHGDAMVRAGSSVTAYGGSLVQVARRRETVPRDWLGGLAGATGVVHAALDALLDQPAFVAPAAGARA